MLYSSGIEFLGSKLLLPSRYEMGYVCKTRRIWTTTPVCMGRRACKIADRKVLVPFQIFNVLLSHGVSLWVIIFLFVFRCFSPHDFVVFYSILILKFTKDRKFGLNVYGMNSEY